MTENKSTILNRNYSLYGNNNNNNNNTNNNNNFNNINNNNKKSYESYNNKKFNDNTEQKSVGYFDSMNT